MITVYKKSRTFPLLGKQVILLLRKRRYLCPYCRKRFTEPYSFLPSYHRRTRRAGILHCLPAPADLFLKTDRKAYRCFRPDGLPPSGHDLLSLRLTSFHKRFPLTNSKAMLLPVKYQCILVEPKSAGSSTFSQIGPRAIWLIIGGTFPGKNA